MSTIKFWDWNKISLTFLLGVEVASLLIAMFMAVSLSLKKDPLEWPGGEVITAVLPAEAEKELEGQLDHFQIIDGSVDPLRLMPLDRGDAIRLFREHSNASVMLESPLTAREKKLMSTSVIEEEVTLKVDGKISKVQLIMHQRSAEHLGDFIAFLKHPETFPSGVMSKKYQSTAEGRKS
ncbi:MAG: hypothetical protein OEM26_04375 [Saprospiraceae bacterium]|nr:hypothetical protein [Saprospiraceae bacterium]